MRRQKSRRRKNYKKKVEKVGQVGKEGKVQLNQTGPKRRVQKKQFKLDGSNYQEDRTGGKEDRRTEGQEDRSTGGQEDRRLREHCYFEVFFLNIFGQIKQRQSNLCVNMTIEVYYGNIGVKFFFLATKTITNTKFAGKTFFQK